MPRSAVACCLRITLNSGIHQGRLRMRPKQLDQCVIIYRVRQAAGFSQLERVSEVDVVWTAW